MIEEPDTIVDWTALAQTRARLGPGFVRILGYFREDGDKSVAAIEEAMHRKDAAALVTPASTLKSDARQFGAEPLGELAEDIEFAARHAVEMRIFPDEMLPAVARLRPLYTRTVELLERECNPLVERRAAAARAAANQEFGRI